SGHYLDLNGPIALSEDTEIKAAVFVRDPQLPPIDTPNGRLEFLQIVGITLDELQAVRAWNGEAFLEVVARGNSLYLTDLGRPSILANPANAEMVRAGTERDGSSTAAVFGTIVRWQVRPEGAEITLGAHMVPDALTMLRGRILHGRD